MQTCLALRSALYIASFCYAIQLHFATVYYIVKLYVVDHPIMSNFPHILTEQN